MAKNTLSDKKITSCLPHLTTRQKKHTLRLPKLLRKNSRKMTNGKIKLLLVKMNECFAEFETRKVKGISLDEAEARNKGKL